MNRAPPGMAPLPAALLVAAGLAVLLLPIWRPETWTILLTWPATAALLVGLGSLIGRSPQAGSVLPVVILTGLVWFLSTPLLMWALATFLSRPALPPLLLFSAGAGLLLTLLWYGWPALVTAARGTRSVGDLLAAVADQVGPPPLARLPMAVLALIALLPLPMLVLLDRYLGDFRIELLLVQAFALPLTTLLAAIDVRRHSDTLIGSDASSARRAGTTEVAAPAAAAPGADTPIPVEVQAARADTPSLSINERLYVAVAAGLSDRALALLSEGADSNALPAVDDHDQRTLPMLAALLPDLRVLRALIAAGADVNRSHAGLTPLLAATRDSWHGRVEAVTMLLTNGADPRATEASGATALHHAARNSDPAIAIALLDAGAEIDALDRERLSPLATACAIGNWPLVKVLLERGATPQPDGGLPALIPAASGEDNVTGVHLLLRHKAKPDACDETGRSALIHAAGLGNAEIVAALLAAGADVDRAADDGSTAMLAAAREGRMLSLCALAPARPDPHASLPDGRNALALLAESDRASEACVELLLGLGVDPAQRDRTDHTPLDHLIAAGRWRLVRVLDPSRALPVGIDETVADANATRPEDLLRRLLEQGRLDAADDMAAVSPLDSQRASALLYDLAADIGREAVEWLLEFGADPGARLEVTGGDSIAFALLDRVPSTAATLATLLDRGTTFSGAGGLARFLSAARNGPHAPGALIEAMALRLLASGADPFASGPNGDPPLHLAIRLGFTGLTRSLLEHGVDANARDRLGQTALHLAAASGDETAVRMLIRHGGTPERPTSDGQTAHGLALAAGHRHLARWLHWPRWKSPGRPLHSGDLPAAAMMGDAVAVDGLLDLGLAIDTRDSQGCTALLRAAGGGYSDVVQRLLDRGADTRIAANTGATPLSAAISMRQAEIVDSLLAAGANPSQPLPGAITPLMLACALGFPELARALLTAGAQVSDRDEQAFTALHCAAMYAFQARDPSRVAELIDTGLSAGSDIDGASESGHTPLLLVLGARAEPGTPCREDVVLTAVERLLAAGASLDVRDQRGFGPLHLAALHGLGTVVRRLLAAGADPDLRDRYNRPPREIALLRGYVDIAAEFDAPRTPNLARFLRTPDP